MVTASPSRAINGSGNYSIAKEVDVASAPGDLGVPMFGVRVPASPSPATTSAGRYSTVAVDEEGKIVPAGFGAPAQQVQSRTDLTTTADVALVASAATHLPTGWVDQAAAQLQRIAQPGAERWRKSIVEKQATYSCVAGLPRPGVATPHPRLFLAGDYTAGPYPATLESATQSGVQSAALLLETL